MRFYAQTNGDVNQYLDDLQGIRVKPMDDVLLYEDLYWCQEAAQLKNELLSLSRRFNLDVAVSS